MFKVGDIVKYTGGLYWDYEIGTRFVITCISSKRIDSSYQWLGMVCPKYNGDALITTGQKPNFSSTCFKLVSKKRPWNVRT